ncbi:helix-turn-helix domain-containing protein [Streptomyces justiciae]|uniref:Helix-turn-helix domain-containing protein n=1 Tax=Streptomyces justiciae TaxID=2780140 RepID=A0ABU3M171_9ACTN|nr:helix-turn-helix domain-containing protein [Streptomyces justiciae]MDT7844503.1 helix-turn-helix domain-containing protein [Streptomyces justiciae]
MGEVPEPHSGWTFLTSHARVLAAIAEDQSTRIRDIAARCRLTERAVQKIISDLESDGYLTHTREGRSNTYQIQPGTILRHPAESGLTVSELLNLLANHEARREPAEG